MKKIVLLTLSIIALMSLSVYSWEGDTHRGITGEVAGPSKTLGEYLKSVGIPGGDQAIFSLSEDFYWPGNFKDRWESGDFEFKLPGGQPALNWLLAGSVDEDDPMIRASHHFHDPTTG